MSENVTPSEKLEQLKEEYKNDPLASALYNSNWMKNLVSEIEKPEESTSGQVNGQVVNKNGQVITDFGQEKDKL